MWLESSINRYIAVFQIVIFLKDITSSSSVSQEKPLDINVHNYPIWLTPSARPSKPRWSLQGPGPCAMAAGSDRRSALGMHAK